MMDFYIRQNATLPYLKVKVFKDGRNEYKEFADSLTASTITFSMYDEETQVYKILDRPASIMSDGNTPPNYYVYYQFRKTDSKKVGRYIGEFKITNSQGEITLPLRETLYVNVLGSFADSDTCCRPNRGEAPVIFPSETPRSTPTPTPSVTPTLSNTPTSTVTPTPSNTPTSTVTPTPSNTPTQTPNIVTSNLQLHLSPSSYVGSGSVWDTLVGSTDATLSGSPTYNTSSGFTFNGTTQYGRIPSVDGVTNFDNTDEYSIELWFKAESGQPSSTTATLFEKWVDVSAQFRYPYAFRYNESNETLRVACYDGTNSSGVVTTGISTNTWYQIVAVFDFTTDVLSVYKNGTFFGSSSLSSIGTISNASRVGIFNRLNTAGSPFLLMKGTMGTVRIYSSALTSGQVLQNYNYGF